MILKKSFLLLLIGFIIAGCGYRPASYFVKDSLGDSIYVAVDIPIRSPEYAIAITDAVREAVVGRFKADIAKERKTATSVLEIKSAKYSISGIQTDEKGLTVLYRASVTLKAAVSGKKISKKSFSVNGTYDFPAGTDTALSEQKKLDGVKEAATKALDGLMSQLAIQLQ